MLLLKIFINHWSSKWSLGFLVFLKHHRCFKFPVKCHICFVLTCHYSNVLALMVVAHAPSTAVAGVGSAFCFGRTFCSPWDNNTDIMAFTRSKDNIQWPHYGITCVLVQRSTIFCQEDIGWCCLYQLKRKTFCFSYSNTYFYKERVDIIVGADQIQEFLWTYLALLKLKSF